MKVNQANQANQAMYIRPLCFKHHKLHTPHPYHLATGVSGQQGGILFWLRGSLQGLLTISQEIALFNNQKSFNKAHFQKLPVNYPD
jgi:hypothetical protein